MSDPDEILTGQEANEARAGYEPMAADPRLPQEDDDKPTHGSDRDSMIEAANELAKSRGQERPLIERAYVSIGGEEGARRPATETITAERAADDLRAIRDAEIAEIEQVEDRVVADAVDGVQGRPTQSEIEAAAAQYQAHQAQLAAQQQAQAEPLPEGVNPELYKLLRDNPAVSQALQAELSQVEAARKQYATSAFHSAQIAAASLVASEPMLQGISPDQMGVALQLLERQSPEKAASVCEHLGRVQQLYNIAQQAKAQEAQIQAQSDQARIHGYMRSQEVLFEHSMKSENPETVKQVKAEIGNIIEKDYGVSREELVQAFRTNSALHSAAFQRMMYDAAKYKLAQRTAARAAPKPVLPVQRPGVAGSYSGDNSDVKSARSEFLRSPNPRNAARMIAARRRAS